MSRYERGLLEDRAEVDFDYAKIANVISHASLASDPHTNILRYLPFLPLDDRGPFPPLSVGWTPTYEAPRLATALDVARVWIKDETRLPTGSFEDRASFVLVARAAQHGHDVIAVSATGARAISLACVAASMAITTYVFVPSSADQDELDPLSLCGAHVLRVNGDVDACNTLCHEAAQAFGWSDLTASAPYGLEGKKTCGHEIAEQLTSAVMPDWVAVGDGDSTSTSAVLKGLVEMKGLGIITRVPQLLAPNERKDHAWDSRLAHGSGVRGEATSLAAIAEARRAQHIRAEETVLAVVTGRADLQAARSTATLEAPIEPDLDAVRARLARTPNA